MKIGKEECRIRISGGEHCRDAPLAFEIGHIRVGETEPRRSGTGGDQPRAIPAFQLLEQDLREFDDPADRGIVVDDVEIIDRARSPGPTSRRHASLSSAMTTDIAICRLRVV